MAINVTLNISEAGVSGDSGGMPGDVDELRAQMGDHIGPFPPAGVDGFLSHFIITVQFTGGEREDEVLSWTMPTAIQTVSRSDPFIYQGGGRDRVSLPLPSGCTLPDSIAESDFLSRPDGYFDVGKETVWMQILNLDARMDTEVGPVRIILGETLKREYPDIFAPSLGVARSLGRSGFPARLFFNPVAVLETPFGALRAIHGTLAYGRIVSFPPVGTPVTIQDIIPMHPVESIRAAMASRGVTSAAEVEPRELQEAPARIIALSHPIDVPLQLSGEEAFHLVERRTMDRG
jgi:hypothetical protein